jgi:hypothetical protein
MHSEGTLNIHHKAAVPATGGVGFGCVRYFLDLGHGKLLFLRVDSFEILLFLKTGGRASISAVFYCGLRGVTSKHDQLGIS